MSDSHGQDVIPLSLWSAMNLLIGFVILICLIASELRAPESFNDGWTRLGWVAFTGLTVPGLALFQTLIVSRRLKTSNLESSQQDAILRRVSVCHSAVWLTASLAIIWAIRWQDVVRESWDLDRWPLVDEVLILAPILFSLIASWAIFFEIHHGLADGRHHRLSWQGLKARFEYVALRVRVYFLIMLIPILLAILSRDLAPWLEWMAPWQATLALTLAGLTIMAGFPFVLLLLWRNQKIEDDALRSDLLQTCQQLRIYVHDIRVWNTGNQIVNALVAGILPGFRLILLSDYLLELFPRDELQAIVRHEAGHLRLWHLPIRILFIVLPLIALTIDEQNPSGLIWQLESFFAGLGLPAYSGIASVTIVYLGYLLISMSWLSHQMEFEADAYACRAVNDTGTVLTKIDKRRTQQMSDALLRLAAINPSQLDRNTLFHPSLRQRICQLKNLAQSTPPRRANASSKQRSWALMVLATCCILVAAIGWW